jgi:lactoylglutathione lyase
MKSKFAYVGIRVTNLQRSVDFYTKVIGMHVKGRSRIDQTKGETVGLETEKDGFILELNYYEKNSPFNTKYVVGEGLDHLAFKVDNLEKALKEADKAGYRTILEIKADGGRWAYVGDPDGIWIELF